ncbi:hypothetical protein GCM10027355_10440 [Haloplanus salinarum]
MSHKETFVVRRFVTAELDEFTLDGRGVSVLAGLFYSFDGWFSSGQNRSVAMRVVTPYFGRFTLDGWGVGRSVTPDPPSTILTSFVKRWDV